MLRSISILSLGLCALPAQDLTARNFFFDDYRNVLEVDFKVLRECGIWDDIESSPLNVILGAMEKQLGLVVGDLDRVTTMMRLPPGEESHEVQLTVLESRMDMPAPVKMWGEWRRESVGKYEVLTEDWHPDEGTVQVSPRLRVGGDLAEIRPVLEGKPRTGLPSGEVMSLFASKRDLVLAAAFEVASSTSMRETLNKALPDADWPLDDKPTFVCIRLRVTGDEDDPHLLLEVVLRHGQDGAGLVASEAAVASALQRLQELPQARIVRPLLKQVQHSRDGTDAVWRVDLGRSRNVVGMLATLSPFLMLGTAEIEHAAAVQFLEVEDFVVEPEEPKPEPEKKKPPVEKKGEHKGGQ